MSNFIKATNDQMFKAILVTGARQVGKTTMLKNINQILIMLH